MVSDAELHAQGYSSSAAKAHARVRLLPTDLRAAFEAEVAAVLAVETIEGDARRQRAIATSDWGSVMHSGPSHWDVYTRVVEKYARIVL